MLRERERDEVDSYKILNRTCNCNYCFKSSVRNWAVTLNYIWRGLEEVEAKLLARNVP
jgi:hypothetical protein